MCFVNASKLALFLFANIEFKIKRYFCKCGRGRTAPHCDTLHQNVSQFFSLNAVAKLFNLSHIFPQDMFEMKEWEGGGK